MRRFDRAAIEGQGMARTILIVEDNDLNMKLFRDLLEAHGYDTLQAKNGADALTLIRSRRPDLIIMDMQLPEVSGLDVTRQIKSDDAIKSIPVVAVTAFAGWRREPTTSSSSRSTTSPCSRGCARCCARRWCWTSYACATTRTCSWGRSTIPSSPPTAAPMGAF